MRVEAFLRARAAIAPSATALVAGSERLSFADLDHLARCQDDKIDKFDTYGVLVS